MNTKEEIFKKTLKMNQEIILINQINEKHQNHLKTELNKYNLTYGQLKFLLALKDNPKISQKEISEIYRINESSVTRSIRKLETKNFITRIISPTNHRKKEIKLTETTEQILKEIIKTEKEWNKEINTKLNNEEKKQLNNLLNKIINEKTEEKIKTEEKPKKQVTAKRIFGQEYKIKKD